MSLHWTIQQLRDLIDDLEAEINGRDLILEELEEQIHILEDENDELSLRVEELEYQLKNDREYSQANNAGC